MALQGIQAFLERFKVMKPPQAAVKQSLAAAIEHAIGLKLQPSRISIRNESAFLTLSGPARSEVHVKKQQIIAEVEERTGLRLRDLR